VQGNVAYSDVEHAVPYSEGGAKKNIKDGAPFIGRFITPVLI
jgi:hypothetical protein